VILTPDELYGSAIPRGFRPAVPWPLNGAWVVASETCAFDLIDAEYVREIEPGELVRISRGGVESIRFAAAKPSKFCIFEHVYFSRPGQHCFRASGKREPRKAGWLAGEAASGGGGPGRSGAGIRACLPGGICQRVRNTFPDGADPHHYIGRTFIEPRRPFVILA